MSIQLIPPISGSMFDNYYRIMRQNNFDIDRSYLARFIYTSLISALGITPLSLIEKMAKQKAIEQTRIEQAPIFIIGHWRSGTTFLHYLMGKDQQFGYLNCAQSFCPARMFHHSFSFIKTLIGLHLPNKRPVDDMDLNLDLPQEEEFALSNLTSQSCYHWWSFPKKMRSYFEKYVLLQNLSTTEYQSFQKSYYQLIQKISLVNNGQRLLLKNPPNTGRIPFLLELFPNAQFIYLYRKPSDVYHSTLKLHNKLLESFSLQNYDTNEIAKNTLDFYKQLITKYEQDKQLIPQGNLIELDYRQLTQSPMNTLEQIYQSLNITAIAQARPAFQNFIDSQKDYRAATYMSNPKLLQELNQAIQCPKNDKKTA